jgi:hypothetical protein
MNGMLPCQKTCIDKTQKEACPLFEGCQCKAGFVRHPDTYKCIPQSECSTISRTPACGPFQKWCNCVDCNERSCELKNDYDQTKNCTPGCICMDGFSKSSETGQCLRWNFCGCEYFWL